MFPGATEAHALPLATTNYEADEDGTLHAVLPSRCVYATGEQTCAMFVDHYRKRKTGPCYPVLPGGGGGVPCAWEAALHAVCSRALSVRTGGGSAVQRKRRTVVGS